MNNIEGRQPVLELFRSGQPINKIWVAKGEQQGSIKKILQLAKEEKVVVQEVERQYLDKISETHSHQGVIAQVAAVTYLELEDLIAKVATSGTPGFYLLLDGIQDPHNLGSLIRTGEAAGISGVIIPKHRAVGVNATVAKTSAGAVSHLPICRVTNIVTAMERLKEVGCWVIGADMSGEVCYEQNLTGPMALVIGGEGKGLGRLVKERCDLLVSLPMYGQINSLNASVAGALLMYEIVRQRNKR